MRNDGAPVAKFIPESDLATIEDAVRACGGVATISEIADRLSGVMPRRTLQYRLYVLVEAGRLVKAGEKRWTRYRLPEAPRGERPATATAPVEAGMTLSVAGTAIRDNVRRPLSQRTPVGYRREFLDAYQPNTSAYLTDAERAHLAQVGRPPIAPQPAGTYARQILGRLLIDLSWNSSRLEGNTYSLLDTKRLIEFGEEAEGRDRLEAQMILNHKEAIEFLVSQAEDIGFNRYTILNLHAMLASNLLPDEGAAGRLRHIAVGIERSVFHPLEAPQLIEECFDRILTMAAAIEDPFEQALFFMVHLPYLQPFDDVNKRVSRLGVNIPLVKANLVPLSFTDVPQSSYTEAILGVYELNRVELLKDVFVWAYERSAARYAAVQQSLGEPDPFRLRHREALRSLVGEIVRTSMPRRQAAAHIAAYAQQNVAAKEREPFREVAENELLSLHEGNFARYGVRPAAFRAWQQAWNKAP